MTDDVRKLLGGYATGTLSEDEKKLLFDSALHDDQLFAALADEEALKELLNDPAVRADLLRATGEDPRRSFAAVLREWFGQPKAKAALATAAVLLGVIGFRIGVRTGFDAARDPGLSPSIPHAAPAPQMAVLRPPKATPSEAAPAASAPPQVRRQARPAPPKAKPVELKREQPAELKEPEPEVVASAAPPPPLPPAPATPSNPAGPPALAAPAAMMSAYAPAALTASGQPLRYEVLRLEADGLFRPAGVEYEFNVDDQIRLRLTSLRAGTVSIRSPGQAAVNAVIQENQPVEIPANGTIRIAPETAELTVLFAPLDAAGLMRTAEVQGLVAGASAKARQASTAQSTLRIPIRVRKR